MNFVDEQAGERCHKRYKYARPHLARKTSGKDNLTDLLRHSLTWSDPKMSYLEYKLQPKSRAEHDEFSRRMAWYTVGNADSSIQDYEPSDEEPDDSDAEEEEYSDEDSCDSS